MGTAKVREPNQDTSGLHDTCRRSHNARFLEHVLRYISVESNVKCRRAAEGHQGCADDQKID